MLRCRLSPAERLLELRMRDVPITAAVSEAVIGWIMHQLITALAGLHGRRIVHRDVKPGSWTDRSVD